MWRHIESGTLSSNATLNINVPPNCDLLEVILSDIIPSTDNTNLWMRYSQSGAFLSGVADYAWDYFLTTAATQVVDESDDAIEMSNGQGNAAGEVAQYRIVVFRPLVSGARKFAFFEGVYLNPTGNTRNVVGGKGRLIANTNPIDRIQFLYSAGVIASGHYAVNAARFVA